MDFLQSNFAVKSQTIELQSFGIKGYSLNLQCDYLIHPVVSGNKFRKTKYNLREATKQQHHTILTFGGAYSNHISAVAAAGLETGFQTIGIIRGEEIASKAGSNPTLSFARKCGMQLHFISRELYRQKDQVEFLDNLRSKFGRFYLLPEGGTNELAVKGCEEILGSATTQYDVLCVPVGTGGTMAGMVRASTDQQTVLGFSALKGTFQNSVIEKYTARTNYRIIDKYSFGGYGKIDIDLIRFINAFKQKTGIPLDPVYTGKMMYGLMEMMKNGDLKENSRIFAVHTGGLQGIAGMNRILEKKNLPIIE